MPRCAGQVLSRTKAVFSQYYFVIFTTSTSEKFKRKALLRAVHFKAPNKMVLFIPGSWEMLWKVIESWELLVLVWSGYGHKGTFWLNLNCTVSGVKQGQNCLWHLFYRSYGLEDSVSEKRVVCTEGSDTKLWHQKQWCWIPRSHDNDHTGKRNIFINNNTEERYKAQQKQI